MKSALISSCMMIAKTTVMTVLERINLPMRRLPLLFIRVAFPIPHMAVSTVKKMTGPAVAFSSLKNTACTGSKNEVVNKAIPSVGRTPLAIKPRRRPATIPSSSRTPGLM